MDADVSPSDMYIIDWAIKRLINICLICDHCRKSSVIIITTSFRMFATIDTKLLRATVFLSVFSTPNCNSLLEECNAVDSVKSVGYSKELKTNVYSVARRLKSVSVRRTNCLFNWSYTRENEVSCLTPRHMNRTFLLNLIELLFQRFSEFVDLFPQQSNSHG